MRIIKSVVKRVIKISNWALYMPTLGNRRLPKFTAKKQALFFA